MEEQEVEYFFDSYAILEIIDGNDSYKKFINIPITITVFNLAEIYLASLKHYTKEKANEIYKEYLQCVVEIPEEVMKNAMKFKLKHNKKRFSYADCIGYIYAIRNKMKFLTGDKEFKDLKNVEFVR